MWAKQKQQSGFTIVELLIVIVVIGILAAITIVAYNGIQSRARSSVVSSALAQAAKKIATWQVDNPGVMPSALSDVGISDTANVTYQYSQTNAGAGYCITATSGGVSYKVTDSTQPAAGGCAGHGVGGVAAITNYALDPNAAGSGSAFGYAGTPVAATRTIAADRSHDGTTSLKTVVTGASGQTGAQARVPGSVGMRVNTGEKVSWSFWVYSTKAGTITPYMDGSKVADSTYTGASSTSVAIPANAWTKVTGTFTAGLDLYVTQIGGYNLAVAAGDTVWFDSYLVEKSATLDNYADGDTPNWVWNGSPNNATSTGPPV